MTLPLKMEGLEQCKKAEDIRNILKALYDVSIIQDNEKLSGDLFITQMNVPLCEALGIAINSFSDSQPEHDMKTLLIKEVQSNCLVIE